jgi:hypothetical protein
MNQRFTQAAMRLQSFLQQDAVARLLRIQIPGNGLNIFGCALDVSKTFVDPHQPELTITVILAVAANTKVHQHWLHLGRKYRQGQAIHLRYLSLFGDLRTWRLPDCGGSGEQHHQQRVQASGPSLKSIHMLVHTG